MTDAEQRTRDTEAAAEIQIIEEQNQKGTYSNLIRYEHIKADDPDRKAKRAAQRDQFTADAKAGRVLCLSDLMISHGM